MRLNYQNVLDSGVMDATRSLCACFAAHIDLVELMTFDFKGHFV